MSVKQAVVDRTAWRYIPADRTLCSYRCKNLKSSLSLGMCRTLCGQSYGRKGHYLHLNLRYGAFGSNKVSNGAVTTCVITESLFYTQYTLS
jgi:hypothetical protein